MAQSTREGIEQAILLEQLLLLPFSIWVDRVAPDVKEKYRDFFERMSVITDNGRYDPYMLSIDNDEMGLDFQSFLKEKLLEHPETQFLILEDSKNDSVVVGCNAQGKKIVESIQAEWLLQKNKARPMRLTLDEFKDLYEGQEMVEIPLTPDQMDKLIQTKNFSYALDEKTGTATLLKSDFIHLEHNMDNDLLTILLQADVNAVTAKTQNAKYENNLKYKLSEYVENEENIYIAPMGKGDYYIRKSYGMVQLIDKQGMPVKGMEVNVAEFHKNKDSMSKMEKLQFYNKLNTIFSLVKDPIKINQDVKDRISAENKTENKDVQIKEFIEDHLFTGDITDFIQDKNYMINLDRIGADFIKDEHGVVIDVEYGRAITENDSFIIQKNYNINELEEENKFLQEVLNSVKDNQYDSKYEARLQEIMPGKVDVDKIKNQIFKNTDKITRSEQNQHDKKGIFKLQEANIDSKNLAYLKNSKNFMDALRVSKDNSIQKEYVINEVNSDLFKDPKEEVIMSRLVGIGKDSIISEERDKTINNIVKEYQKLLIKEGASEAHLNEAVSKLRNALENSDYGKIYTQREIISTIEAMKDELWTVNGSHPFANITEQELTQQFDAILKQNDLDEAVQKRCSKVEDVIKDISDRIKKEDCPTRLQKSIDKRINETEPSKDMIKETKDSLDRIRTIYIKKYIDEHGLNDENANRNYGGERERFS
jgi:hypothetical protein